MVETAAPYCRRIVIRASLALDPSKPLQAMYNSDKFDFRYLADLHQNKIFINFLFLIKNNSSNTTGVILVQYHLTTYGRIFYFFVGGGCEWGIYIIDKFVSSLRNSFLI